MRFPRSAILGFLTSLLLDLSIGQAANAQDVEIRVQLDATVAPGVPEVFAFGGNIWHTPAVFGLGVAERILAMPHPGTTRVSLGDQLLEQATSLDDLKRRLATFPLNGFLRRFAAAGGRVLLILDGTPRWISSDASTEKRVGPGQPVYRMSPPTDDNQWSAVVEAVVRHFNGTLGLDAWYEAWNEPNYYYLGSTERFLRQYRHSVLGARRADPRARVGGPGISEFIGTTTAGDSAGTPADTLRIAGQVLAGRYLFRQFLEYAARTPLPEVGLERLPVDFFSWHTFYIDPTRFYQVTVPRIRAALADTGYPRTTPIVISEWNLAAVPPYPEGDLNATEVGAAYTATSLLAMHEAGVDAQSFQMYVDPGGDGYYGGMFTVHGVARATFQAFRLVSMLRGRQVKTASSDPWIRCAAFVDDGTTYLLVTSLVPTVQMLTQTQGVVGYLEQDAFLGSVAKAGLVEAMLAGKLPEPYAGTARRISDQGQRSLQAETARAASRQGGATLAITLSGLRAPPGRIERYRIDARHANVFPELAQAQRLLDAEGRRSQELLGQWRERLRQAGIPDRASERLLAALSAGKPLDDAITAVADGQRAAARRTIEAAMGELMAQRAALIERIEGTPAAALTPERLAWAGDGPLRLDIPAQAVQLLVLTP